MPNGDSPLKEADPNSLQILFDRVNDKLIMGLPEAITDEDLMPLVKIFRDDRKTFLVEQDRLGKAPGRRKAKPTSVAEVVQDINVDDLD